jgi:parallel beta-helix repeat protein
MGSATEINAAPPKITPSSPSKENPASKVITIWVNPSSGVDQTNHGSRQTPVKTLTYALQYARSGTIIQLTPGTYSAQTGEQFPLILKPGVILQGNAQSFGQGIVIQGGGFYLSRTSARQDVAMLAADNATISGVTVSNTNPRGYGIWVESSTPTIRNNTFTQNTHDGVSVVGTSRPLIEGNVFTQNGANGVTVFGSSQPIIQGNTFERTGFAINVAGRATPQINQNVIRYNKDGIVVQGNSQPTLRGNTIEQSERDGVVVISQAVPNLGTGDQPGNNTFRNNSRFDVNNSTRSVVAAYGNQWFTNRMNGAVSLAKTSAPIASSQPMALMAPPPPISRSPLPPRPAYNPSAGYLPPPPPAYTAPAATVPVPSYGGSGKPTLPPLPNQQAYSAPPSLPPMSGRAPSPTPASRSYTPPIYTGYSSSNIDPRTLRYRVIVVADSYSVQEQVRQLVPGAFRTRSGGRTMMQAGAFSDRAEADDLAQKLVSNGLPATVESR